MGNDIQTILKRKAVKLGTVTRFTLPPFPALPDSFLKRFPELLAYEEDKKRWTENLNQAVAQALSANQGQT